MRILVSAIMLLILLAPAPVVLADAPANDDIDNAVNIGSLPYTSPPTNITDATADESDPSLPSDCFPSPETGNKPYKTVWYKHTATQTALVRVHTAGSEYDTVLAVWAGSPGSFTLSGCNDDMAGPKQSSLDIWFAEGTQYYIEVAAFSLVEEGNLSLTVDFISHLIYLPLVLDD